MREVRRSSRVSAVALWTMLAVVAAIGMLVPRAAKADPPGPEICTDPNLTEDVEDRAYPPAGPGFCSGSFAAACNGAAPVVSLDRENVVVAVLDDHGYCQHGFMAGRVVAARNGPLQRCTGRVCESARWITCDGDSDCPDGDTCGAAPSGECPSGSSCTHGYCSQCTTHADCAWVIGERCHEGLCSPRADCTEAGVFACAQGDSCNPIGNPCFAGSCFQTHEACTVDADCPVIRLCLETPASCSRNTDAGEEGYACTSSSKPLRLNDLSCRYRVGDSEEWDYEPETSTRNGPPLEQIVHTPLLDELAREGAVFPRAFGGAQTCKPGRRTLLTGRLMRHHRNASQKNGGDGVRQCEPPPDDPQDPDDDLDAPIGCDPLAASSSDCAGRACEPVHSIPWWLENAGPGVCKNSSATCTDDATCTTGQDDECLQARTIGVGKSHFINFNKLSFDVAIREGSSPAIGKFPCDSDGCQQAMRDGEISCQMRREGEAYSFAPIYDEIATLTASGQQREPLFLYYAPHLPHEPGNAGPYFRGLYETPNETTLEDDAHLARTSWFDAGLRGIVDELRRTCVCTGAGTAESMYDRTTVIVLPDHGFLMDRAKNDNGFASSNAQRQALIVNAREHRGRAQGVVLDPHSTFAASQDVMPTVLDYAGLTSAHTRELVPGFYPLHTSLRALARDGMSALPGFLRTHYSHSGENSGSSTGVAEGTRHYFIPEPDAIGLCADAETPQLCFSDADCGGSVECEKRALRCVNDPTRSCETDEDCGICDGGACATGFEDFDTTFAGAPRSCEPELKGRDCDVPAGTCAPPVFKLVRKSGVIVDAFELNSDPDEKKNLITTQQSGDPLYFAPGLLAEAGTCLNEFFTLRPADAVWDPSSQCSAALREW